MRINPAKIELRGAALKMPLFSVIMPTRNRPQQFAEALASVLAQSRPADEIIVVNDGSAEEHWPSYRATLAGGGDRIKSLALPARTNGHGGPYALNFGSALAAGEYLCFLDDDDLWTDAGHLERARALMESNRTPIDLYMSHQVAWFRGREVDAQGWIGGVAALLESAGIGPDDHGSYTVSVEALMLCGGSCHLNTTIISRELFRAIGGFDENNRWEYDRDLYLRAIDRARLIKYSPKIVAQHNVPDPAAASSITTSTPAFERRLFQIRTADRAILFAVHPAIRQHGREQKGSALKKVAESLAGEGKHVEAAYYAREALGVQPGLKWLLYTFWRVLRAELRARTLKAEVYSVSERSKRAT